MDNIEKYVETIFASGVRVSSPLEQLNLDNNFKKPNFCDIIGSILYDRDSVSYTHLTLPTSDLV